MFVQNCILHDILQLQHGQDEQRCDGEAGKTGDEVDCLKYKFKKYIMIFLFLWGNKASRVEGRNRRIGKLLGLRCMK